MWPPPEQMTDEEIDAWIDEKFFFTSSTESTVIDGEPYEVIQQHCAPRDGGILGSYGRNFFDLYGPDNGMSADSWNWTSSPIREKDLDLWMKYGMIP